MNHEKGDRCPVSSKIGCIKFSQGCTEGSKVCFEVGNDLQSFPKDLQRNKRPMGNKIEVWIAKGLDVPNIFKNVPNFVKDVPNL